MCGGGGGRGIPRCYRKSAGVRKPWLALHVAIGVRPTLPRIDLPTACLQVRGAVGAEGDGPRAAAAAVPGARGDAGASQPGPHRPPQVCGRRGRDQREADGSDTHRARFPWAGGRLSRGGKKRTRKETNRVSDFSAPGRGSSRVLPAPSPPPKERKSGAEVGTVPAPWEGMLEAGPPRN